MSKYWYVLQTYLWRPRFWVLGFCYLFFVWAFLLWETHETHWEHALLARGQVVASAVYGCLAGSFLALHLRRQFTNEPAIAIPGFAQPHLVVAALISLLLWAGVPGAAIAVGWWPASALAVHAFAAILTAVIACWPRALLLLAAVPVLLIWQGQTQPRGQAPLLVQLVEGERPALGGAMMLVALAANVAAGWWMLRLPRQGVTTNDEFTLDAGRTAQDMNPFNRWLLKGRDAAANRLLESRLFTSIQRWRVPLAISPVQLLIPPAVVIAALLVGLSTGEWTNWVMISMIITCSVLLLVPLGPWHVRRNRMAQEMLLPVTRDSYFREIILSLAFDTMLWMAVGSTLMVVTASAVAVAEGASWLGAVVPIAVGLGVLWSMATFVFGIGLATMRLPLWLPIVAAISTTWFLGVWVIVAWVEIASGHRHTSTEVTIFCALNVVVGLLLTTRTYRRWVRGDVA